MAILSNSQGKLFRPFSFVNEKDFEQCVVQLSEQIFGSSTIYIDVKKKLKGNDIVTIPDGYLIDFTVSDSPKLFIVENEIVGHDPFKHIGIQMLKFVTSFEDAQLAVRNFLMAEIHKDKNKLALLEEACEASESRNIDNYLDKAVYGDFRGLVVIDDARPELHKVLEKINANISVLELKAFVDDAGERLYLFDTLYDEEEPVITVSKKPAVNASERERRKVRLAASDTIIVPAKKEGFEREFLGNNQWFAIRIGAAMKDRIRFIAAYQVAPVSAVTYIAEVQDIKPYKDTGKYLVTFKSAAEKIKPVGIRLPQTAPYAPVYAKREELLAAEFLEDVLN